jgi:hypothetical protein
LLFFFLLKKIVNFSIELNKFVEWDEGLSSDVQQPKSLLINHKPFQITVSSDFSVCKKYIHRPAVAAPDSTADAKPKHSAKADNTAYETIGPHPTCATNATKYEHRLFSISTKTGTSSDSTPCKTFCT